jgi:hypothetical protein
VFEEVSMFKDFISGEKILSKKHSSVILAVLRTPSHLKILGADTDCFIQFVRNGDDSPELGNRGCLRRNPREPSSKEFSQSDRDISRRRGKW